MSNGYDDENDPELQDQGEMTFLPTPAPQAPPAAAAPQPVAPPAPRNVWYQASGTGPNLPSDQVPEPGPPSVSALPFMQHIGRLQDEATFNNMMKAARSDPNIESAQAAVESAKQFQAQRGYQNDIQGGMAPEQAMVKWAPILFSGGKSMTGAASLIRAVQPRQVAQHADPFKLTEFRSVLSQIAQTQKELADDPKNESARSRLQDLEQRREALSGGQPTTTGTGTAPPAGGAKTVTDKHGRKWTYTGKMADPKQDKNKANWKLAT